MLGLLLAIEVVDPIPVGVLSLQETAHPFDHPAKSKGTKGISVPGNPTYASGGSSLLRSQSQSNPGTNNGWSAPNFLLTAPCPGFLWPT